MREDLEAAAGGPIEIEITMGLTLLEGLSFGNGQAFCGWQLEEIGELDSIRHKLAKGDGCVLFFGYRLDLLPNASHSGRVVISFLNVPSLPRAGGAKIAHHRAFYAIGDSGYWWPRDSDEHDQVVFKEVSDSESVITGLVSLKIERFQVAERFEFVKKEPTDLLRRCLTPNTCREGQRQ